MACGSRRLTLSREKPMPPAMRAWAPGLTILAGESLCLLAIWAFAGTPQTPLPAHPVSPSSHKSSRPVKRTWSTGPASMPLETEVMPLRRSPVPPPVRAQAPSGQAGPKGANTEAAGRVSAGLTLASHPAAVSLKPEITITDESHHLPAPVNSEMRALSDLNRLRADPDARKAFYEDLRRTVEQVRADGKQEVKNRLTSSHP
jgi:hypothetical protein